MTLGGKPIADYAPDFWLIHAPNRGPVGYVTSPWFSPEVGVNIALGYVPWELAEPGTKLEVELPLMLRDRPGLVPAETCDVPFQPSEHPSAREISER